MKRGSYYLPVKGIYTDTPKTSESIRTLAIGEKVESILRDISKIQKELNIDYSPETRIFTASNGDKLNPNSVTKFFHKFVEKYDLPSCSVHTLRHTNASILLSENLPITAVSSRLGHSNPEITFRYYAHQMSDDNRRAANKIENFFRT